MVKAQDPNTSTSYISDEKSVKKFIKQMLRNHKFVGNYLEQRYVPDLGRYKKIVKISNNEDVFIENLSVCKRRIEKFFGDTKWLGITFPNTVGAPVGFNLWVDIDEEIFGTYVFWVRKVEFTEKEIYLKLDVVGPYTEGQSLNDSNMSSFLDSSTLMEDPVMSWYNFKKASVFMFFVTAAMVTGGGQIIVFLMDYILKLLREFSNIIKVTTPIIIACFNTISKMFGYICFLIAVMWKGDNAPKQNVAVQRIQYLPAYPYEQRYKALPYHKSSVQITEIN